MALISMAKRDISFKDIKKVSGLILSLACVFAMLSPFSNFWGVGYGIVYVFGLVGYWFMLPFLILVGISYLLLGSLPENPGGKKIMLTFLCIFVGLGLIMAHAGSGGNESLSDFSIFDGSNPEIGFGLINSQPDKGDMVLLSELGGGALFYCLAAVLNMAGAYLVFIIAVLFIIIGFLILFSRPIAILLRSARANRAIAKTKRKEEKESRRQLIESEKEEKELRAFYEKYINEQESRESLVSAGMEESSLEESRARASRPTLSRVENAMRERIDNPAIAREIPADDNPIFLNLDRDDFSDSGLYPATFSAPGSKPAAPAQPPIQNPETTSQESLFYEIPTAVPSLSSLQVPAQPEAPAPKPTQVVAPSISEPIKTDPAPIAVPLSPEPEPEPDIAPIGDISSQNEPKVEETTPEAEEEDNLIEIPSIVPEPQPAPPIEEAPKPVPAASPTAPKPQPATKPAPAPQPEPEPEPEIPYVLPPIELLNEIPQNGDKEKLITEAEEKMATINSIFEDLSVPCRAVGYTIGPSITRFDLQTAKDASVSQVARYMTDLNIRLGGTGARFEQVVRGKTTSGLEIPNTFTSSVSFKEMFLALPDNSDGSKNMYVPFGKAISGECMSANMADFPHMLVAGTTGSGKSVFVNGMILSLVMRNTPEELRLVMVDPKTVEFMKYHDLPHLLCPVISAPNQAKMALQKLCDEMERRFALFADLGVSNIRGYNSMCEEFGKKKVPFIVVCIDEYTDLKVNCKDVDSVIIRLTAKARAAGIHVILATQRPSADIVDGSIKANLGVQVALMVKNGINSRIILDTEGAEQLIGKGDMLVNCFEIGRNALVRLQGCYVTDLEIAKVCNFIRKESKPRYDPNFLDLRDPEEEEEAAAAAAASGPSTKELKAASDEEAYEEIRRAIMARDYTSASYIQRTFSVGFPRSGKIMARLQKEGVVAAQPDTAFSNKGCKVLIHSETELYEHLNGENEAAPESGGEDA